MIRGLYNERLDYITKINRYYALYEGDQKWLIANDLDYTPTRMVNNYIKKLIDTKSRFMFGIEPFIDIRPLEYNGQLEDMAQEQEDLIKMILDDNKFHKKIMQGYKDSLIAGNVGIKLWAHKDYGLRIIFVPAQEYFIEYDLDDIDKMEAVTIFHFINDEDLEQDQRARKQRFYLENGICYLDEHIVDGFGQIVEVIYQGHNTGLDFIPFINITNGGLTGEVYGTSEVEQLWEIQDIYNKITSDDVDALKFQMFGQTVFENASIETFENLKIAPGAIIDFQIDSTQMDSPGSVYRLESSFSYSQQLEETLKRLKGTMYELMDIPNVSTDQLKGLMTSGKSMETLYWGLIASCDEDWTEWRPQLRQMTQYMLKMVEVYNLYGKGQVVDLDNHTIEIENYYPLKQDELEQKKVDMDEVVHELRSKESYMDKWGNYENVEAELEKIRDEIQSSPKDTYTGQLLEGINIGVDRDDEEETNEIRINP